MSTDNNDEIRREAIVENATEQVRALLETHFKDITRAAEESFVGDENQSEPVASASISVKWSALAAAPKIAVKIGWSVKYSDESETEIDPLQSKLGLGDTALASVVRKGAKEVRASGTTVTAKSGASGFRVDADGIHKLEAKA